MLTGLLGLLASIIIRLFRLTWRIEIEGEHPPPLDRPIVFCFWHGKQAGLFAYPHPRKVAILSSWSRDGELQSRVLGRLGFHVQRGSSSKGGAAGLKGIIGVMRGGLDAAFAVDGPKGPAFKAKRGAIEAGKASDANLVPIMALCESPWVFEKAWDMYELPKPFSRVTIRVGEHIWARTASPVILEEALGKLHTPGRHLGV